MADSPIGRILLVGDGTRLSGLYLADHERAPRVADDAVRDDDAFGRVREQLDEYFASARLAFDLDLDRDLDLQGTPFRVSVWRALADIPYGETISYGELARRVGRPAASRAVGAANGANPISIILPCHRVIGSDGSLTGYGWGLPTKTWLLDHEHAALTTSGQRQRGKSSA